MIKALNEQHALSARAKQAPRNDAMPVTVFISSTDRCNLRCPDCFSNIGRYGEMPFEKFKRLADELFPAAKEYHTTVEGEPLTTSYFLDIVPLLEKHSTMMKLTTNGTLLDGDMAARVMHVLGSVRFSVNGATKEMFERLSLGSDFEGVMRNIERFIRLREHSTNRPKVTLQTVISIDNIAQLPDIVRMAYRLGVERVKAQHMIACNLSGRKRTLWFHQEIANQYLEEAEALAKELGLESKFPRRFGKEKRRKEGRKICHFLWQEGWVQVDGTVISCCHPKHMVMGNAFEKGFASVWNGEEYQDLRKKLNTAKEPAACKTCLLVEAYRGGGKEYGEGDFVHER